MLSLISCEEVAELLFLVWGQGKCHLSMWSTSVWYLWSFLYRTLTWGSPNSSLFIVMKPPNTLSFSSKGHCGLL